MNENFVNNVYCMGKVIIFVAPVGFNLIARGNVKVGFWVSGSSIVMLIFAPTLEAETNHEGSQLVFCRAFTPRTNIETTDLLMLMHWRGLPSSIAMNTPPLGFEEPVTCACAEEINAAKHRFISNRHRGAIEMRAIGTLPLAITFNVDVGRKLSF
jgi:hypothetical protein